LKSRGFDAYLVGGAVRDLKLGKEPKDWDIATNAKPGQVMKVFRKAISTGKAFGTVTVIFRKMPIQVTTYRVESDYKDRRRPSKVNFVTNIYDDLARRDFTFNAMALDMRRGALIDSFGGATDLKKRRLRTVGKARDRFGEDALRIIRAGRFISELSLAPNRDLTLAAKKHSASVRRVSMERVRDEWIKLLVSPKPSAAIDWFDRVGVLKIILPELVRCRGIRQGGWHKYDVYRHTLRCLDSATPVLRIRLVMLLHDLAKPLTRTRDKTGYHFYRHDLKGSEMAKKICRRFRMPNELTNQVASLVRHHLFESDPISKTDAAVRRLMQRVGEQNLNDLIEVRRADVKGCGPHRRPGPALKMIERRAQKIRNLREALSIRDLKIDGYDVMRWKKIPAGPQVGEILNDLLKAVIEDPRKNQKSVLRAIVHAHP
jgi:tRNA nucleotidyltransferase (CCA-adding enzyme)